MSPWKQTESKKDLKLNPQLEIGDTWVLVFVPAILSSSSSATGKCSFQLVQRLLHEILRLHALVATPPFSSKFGCERIDSSSRSPPIKQPHTCKAHLGPFVATDIANRRAVKDTDTLAVHEDVILIPTRGLCA